MPEREGSTIAVVVLGGGAATRLPNKLERELEPGETLLRRVLRNFGRAPHARYLCVTPGGSPLDEEASAHGVCVLRDPAPHAGPLAALVAACGRVRETRIFALAGDAPNVTPNVLDELARAYERGDEAVVPLHDGSLEPLAALYDRAALARAGTFALDGGERSMHAAIGRMTVRAIPMRAEFFLNVNTLDDLHEARAGALMETL
jgi:molybdopterin-guanine dinucleotide biosynthesis protein A